MRKLVAVGFSVAALAAVLAPPAAANSSRPAGYAHG
jgi:hypothetical protein